MVGDEDADVLLPQLCYDRLDVLDGDRVYTSERFIEHDELRVDGQTASYLSTTAFASREPITLVCPYLLEAKLSDELFESCLLLLLCAVC